MTREELLEQARAHAQAASDQSFEGGDRPTILALHAIRLTIAAALAPPAAVEEAPESRWLELELIGDGEPVYGLVSEVRIAGKTFLEVARPAAGAVDLGTDAGPDERVVYHPDAIYSLREVEKQYALAQISYDRAKRGPPGPPF